MKKNKQNIILIGFMGSGKTSVGIRLAKVLSFEFLDMDSILETEYGASINAIFTKHGEAKFREMETSLLMRLSKTMKCSVLSTGGGLPLREENVEVIRQLGKVIFLKTTKETTVARLKDDTNRPLLAFENLEERVEELMNSRLPNYEKAADIIINTDNKSFYEIIKEIEDFRKGAAK